jgi:23S rRNA (pseudouridine1915-N3)-methyltransferase
MYKAFLISVGRLKTPFWREAADFYRQRLRLWRWGEIAVRDADPSLPPEERKKQEGERILTALPRGYARICLHEGGELLDSASFAAFLEGLRAGASPPCFILGGAYGLSGQVLEAADRILSLSPLTFPHELARVLLLEQVYRAESIAAGSGYHH